MALSLFLVLHLSKLNRKKKKEKKSSAFPSLSLFHLGIQNPTHTGFAAVICFDQPVQEHIY